MSDSNQEDKEIGGDQTQYDTDEYTAGNNPVNQAIYNELPYVFWLYSIEGFGRKTIMVLETLIGSAETIYHLPENEMKWLLSERQIHDFTSSRKHWDILGEYQKLKEKGIHFFPYAHPDYPAALRKIPDPPAAVYVRGRLPDPCCRTVAVIGTRKCSGYGSTMAGQLGTALAQAQIQVVSGMARGIDGIGQRAVVEAGGRTFAVLGCGVDVSYPPENRRLYDMIMERGGILSEYTPGTMPKAQLFPPRNRLISGLSEAVIVVEAREKSGTMITVDMALEQGKDVYAIPGRLVDSLSGGCNRLIKQGAGVVLSVEEFIWELGMNMPPNLVGAAMVAERMKKQEYPENLSPEERKVDSFLDYNPQSLSYFAVCCPEIPLCRLTRILISLCLNDRAEQIGTGYYCRKNRLT